MKLYNDYEDDTGEEELTTTEIIVFLSIMGGISIAVIALTGLLIYGFLDYLMGSV